MFLYPTSFKIYETKTDRTAIRNRQIYNYSQTSLLTYLSIIGRTKWKKISDNIEDLNNMINQIDLVDICRTLPTNCRIFKIDPILGCKTNLADFKRIQMTHIMFSEHYGIELKTIKERYLKYSQIFII